MNDEQRLEKFVEIVKQNKEVWLLQADSGMFAMLEDTNGQSYLPVWCGREDALNAIDGDWINYNTELMNLGEFNQWLHELDEDGIKLGVSPDEHGKILPFNGEELRKLLQIGR